MRILLTTFCATYSHTPLALYALKSFCGGFSEQITVLSFTVNHQDDFILRNIYENKPDIIGFSCYIWNIEKTLRVVSSLRLLLPKAVIIFGGPEMAAGYDGYLLKDYADIVVPFEGERPFNALLTYYASQKIETKHHELIDIPGISYVCRGTVQRNPPEYPLDPRDLPFPYPELHTFENKILYYEASRGCPFSCGYCLSSIDDKVRFKPLDTVKKELLVFIHAHVKRVKFTDRSFNIDEAFASAVWQFLMENDTGKTCFHFEIAADLLNEKLLNFLSRARPGLFQFEIGVQTTNEKTLALINRKSNLPLLFENVKRIQSFRNIRLHLDLIAGLPGENRVSFIEAFNQVYALAPDRLQLGFLKLLKGTPLRENASRLGMVYNPNPPYEILYSPDMAYKDLLLLKDVEEMTERFHKSGRFTHTLRFITGFFPSPFEFYFKLSLFVCEGQGEIPHDKMRLFEILFSFCEIHIGKANLLIVKDLIRFDLFANENEKGIPHWLIVPLNEDVKKQFRAYKANSLPARVEFFQTDILQWLRGLQDKPMEREQYLVFTYPEPGRQNPFTLYERVHIFMPAKTSLS